MKEGTTETIFFEEYIDEITGGRGEEIKKALTKMNRVNKKKRRKQ